MSELGVHVSDDIQVLELLYLVEKANIRRRERKESAEKNEIYIG